MSHLTSNDIISYRQAAYLKGDSTVNQLLYIVDYIRKSWSKGHVTQSLFLDISAAFDKVWHNGLLAKLQQISVLDSCYDLFISYLNERKQIVMVDGVKSEAVSIKAGIPQGSRLGPVLFILYINDIKENLESDILIFADDTTLLANASDPNETSQKINRDLKK